MQIAHNDKVVGSSPAMSTFLIKKQQIFLMDIRLISMMNQLGSERLFNADNFVYTPYSTELSYKNKPLSKKQAKNRAASKKARKARKK